jgi:predicted O-methyltransferase YrrM
MTDTRPRVLTPRSILRLNPFEWVVLWMWRRIWRWRIKRYRRLRPAGGIADHIEVPTRLAAEHIANCRLYADRALMLAEWPSGARIAELGTYEGAFADLILRRCDPRELHLFDRDVSRVRRNALLGSAPNVILHQGDSWSGLETFPDGHFDVIYIDADHRLRSVAKDAAVAVHKLRSGGLLVFDDYTTWGLVEMHDYGVVNVVNRLCVDEGFELVGLSLQELMYCNVMLRRRPPTA